MIACCGPRIVFSFTPLAPDGLLLPTLSPSSEPPLRIERAPILRRRPLTATLGQDHIYTRPSSLGLPQPERPTTSRLVPYSPPPAGQPLSSRTISRKLPPRGERLFASASSRESRWRTENAEATRRTLAGQAGRPCGWCAHRRSARAVGVALLRNVIGGLAGGRYLSRAGRADDVAWRPRNRSEW